MTRFHQVLLIGALVPLCWLGMMAVHELGHVLAAWCTGGVVQQVVLHPLALSRTDVSPNPWPIVEIWGGPLFGAVAPLALWGAAEWARWPIAFLLRFFAGFCLVANGAYLGGGCWAEMGDAGELLQHGCPAWLLAAFGIVAVPAGLFLWHQQGAHFGLGPNAKRVLPAAAWGTFSLLAAVVILEMLLSARQ